MDNLLKQLDSLLKPVNEAMRNYPPAQLIRYVTFYCFITGVINLCGSVALITAGALSGAAGTLANASGANVSAEGQQAVAELGKVGGLAVASGVLYLVAAPALILVGIGLYRRMGWSRMGAVIVFALSAVVSLLGLLGGNGILSLLWILIDLYIAYFMYTDSGIKREFGQS